uniref:PheRS DNA binding domain-containing protein n=1 Tax=Aegilops tauschii TaxID=37682 RepID=N1R4Z5_AEGTA
METAKEFHLTVPDGFMKRTLLDLGGGVEVEVEGIGEEAEVGAEVESISGVAPDQTQSPVFPISPPRTSSSSSSPPPPPGRRSQPLSDVEDGLLAHLNANAEIPDSRSFASSLGVPHKDVEDVIKRLTAFRIVESADITKETWVLTDEAKGYAARGSPEVQLVAAIPPEGASKGALKERLGDVFDIGMKAAAKNKWIGFEKGNKDLVLRKVDFNLIKSSPICRLGL